VPKPGYEGKVFYVWFDAPIAYIAATQEWADVSPNGRDWRSWWWEAEDVDYLQFLGKDNVPFHAVSFPCTLIGSREPWKRVDVIKGVNWLTYEGGKFSTSRARGVFLDQALDLLPADYWRWWLAASAPEGADTDFTFARFAADVNHDLADGFGNLANRIVKLVRARWGGVVPSGGKTGEAEVRLEVELARHLGALRRHQREGSLRKAAESVRALWRAGNAYLSAEAPWALLERDPERAAVVIRTGVNLLRLTATAAWPFIPRAAEAVLRALGERASPPTLPPTGAVALTAIAGGRELGDLPLLFPKLSADWAENCTRRFAGSG
jgi:methionyl-tRNA synthetase